jgi:hypothetical protein
MQAYTKAQKQLARTAAKQATRLQRSARNIAVERGTCAPYSMDTTRQLLELEAYALQRTVNELLAALREGTC